MPILQNHQPNNSQPLFDPTLPYSNSISISLGRSTYHIERPKLKIYLCLVETHEKICRVAKTGNIDSLSSLIIKFISFVVNYSDLDNLPWYEIAGAYFDLLPLCDLKSKPPMFMYPQPKEEENEDIWEYEGRTWYLWAHIFSAKYGWTLPYIEEMLPEDAVALLQEIFFEEQTNKEWEWSLSDVSYKTDKNGKVTHVPLPRPGWMQTTPHVRLPKKMKIRKNLIPVGNIVRWDDGKDRNSEDSKSV